ncbi:hypothetical protein U9M48_005352 [Paspalum notatum var. saurae]|uniref:Uncharacterized protein n=1 Tax=Paspalum notatum var. saurae TaxID=547442 RepID=A0AAQ3PXE6_PASNO
MHCWRCTAATPPCCRTRPSPATSQQREPVAGRSCRTEPPSAHWPLRRRHGAAPRRAEAATRTPVSAANRLLEPPRRSRQRAAPEMRSRHVLAGSGQGIDPAPAKRVPTARA